jgi:hypothetical protein
MATASDDITTIFDAETTTGDSDLARHQTSSRSAA